MYVLYEHHGKMVWVKTALMGKHREHCLCWNCEEFHPNPEGREENCPIANKVFDVCVEEDLVLPVWECPKFIPKTEQGG